MPIGLFEVAVCVAVGALVGLAFRVLAPAKCRQFAEWSRRPDRARLFVLGFVMFALASAGSFLYGTVLYGILHAAFALLQLTGLFVLKAQAKR